MKTAILFFSLLLFSTIGFTQERNEINVDSMLVNIDKTTFTSGILYDRVFGLAQLPIFNDTVRPAHHPYFKQALLELYRASNKRKFIYGDEFESLTVAASLQNEVDIGIINASFHTINYNPDNIRSGALDISPDSLFIQINDNPPFLPNHVFIAAPLKLHLAGENVIFNFNPELLLQHTSEGKKIKSLIADFGTGMRYTVMERGAIQRERIEIPYTENGIKTLKLIAVFEDDSKLSTTGFFDFTFQKTPPAPIGIKNDSVFATIPFKGYYLNSPNLLGRLDYRIFYHMENNVPVSTLLKPIVIIDGFDPGDKRQIQDSDPHPDQTDTEHVSIAEMMTYYNSQDQKEFLIPILRNLGYDVVIVNHPKYEVNGVAIDGGADYIERNALTHVQLYQQLNAELTQNNSQEQLVIVGPSMGGQISRYALAYMEKHNIPHNTRLWVSVDSPHLGANIPVGVQTLLNMLNDYGDSAEAKDFVDNQLGSPAAKQQLIEQHQTIWLGNFPFFYQSTTVGQDWLNARTVSQGYTENRGHMFFKRYYNKLYGNGLSGSKGYPQNLRKIAIVNGSLTNSKAFTNPFAQGGTGFTTPYLDSYSASAAQTFKMEGHADVLNHIVTMETYFMPNPGTSHKIAYFKKWKLGWDFYDRFITNNNSRGNLDNIPGGWFPTQRDLTHSIENSTPCEWAGTHDPNWGGYVCVNDWYLYTLKHVNSFIPTASALGFKNPDFNWSQAFNRNLKCTVEIPFDTYFGPRNNEQHTSFTEKSVAWLLAELGTPGNPPTFQPPTVYLDPEDLSGPTVICSTSTQTYSFGICGSAPVVQWELSSNLQSVPSSPSNTYSITVKPLNSSVNSAGYIRAIFDSPNEPVQKDIWIGTPKYHTLEEMDITQISHTMPIAPIGACDEIGLKLNIFPSFSNVQSMEWEKVSTNFQWSQDPPHYNDPYVIITPLCEGPIIFKVRMQNQCGWSNWQQVEYAISSCQSSCGGTGGTGTITSEFFTIHPVPADTVLNVALIGSNPTDLLLAGETLTIQLFNSAGIKVKDINAAACQNSIDVSNLPSGFYTLKITYNNQPETHQIIIN